MAFAGTISTPGTSPFAVPGDAAGHPLSFTIVAQDFGEADAVVVEQCDGADPDSPSWSVTAHCDSGSATGVVLADVDGNATFPADDPVVGFHPFKGASPSGQFNCLSPNQASPNNGLTDYRNCMIRVSTSLTGATPDQALLAIELPEPGGPGHNDDGQADDDDGEADDDHDAGAHDDDGEAGDHDDARADDHDDVAPDDHDRETDDDDARADDHDRETDDDHNAHDHDHVAAHDHHGEADDDDGGSADDGAARGDDERSRADDDADHHRARDDHHDATGARYDRARDRHDRYLGGAHAGHG